MCWGGAVRGVEGGRRNIQSLAGASGRRVPTARGSHAWRVQGETRLLIELDIISRYVRVTIPLRRVLAKSAVPFPVCRDPPEMFRVSGCCRGSNLAGR